jgi:hypothetical protein
MPSSHKSNLQFIIPWPSVWTFEAYFIIFKYLLFHHQFRINVKHLRSLTTQYLRWFIFAVTVIRIQHGKLFIYLYYFLYIYIYIYSLLYIIFFFEKNILIDLGCFYQKPKKYNLKLQQQYHELFIIKEICGYCSLYNGKIIFFIFIKCKRVNNN